MDTQTEFKAGFVAVVGRPNVGKSTLINAFMGQKIAAVSPRPQTTRRQQLGILTVDTAQVIFTDTPGIHHAKHKLGNYMNEEAVMALEDSDVILFVVDASEQLHGEDRLIAETLLKAGRKVPLLLALNKVDLLNKERLAARLDAYQNLVPQAELVTLSALAGESVSELLATLIARLPEHPPFYPVDQVTDLYEREIAADLIREAALLELRDEVPHGIAVRIDEYTEQSDTRAHIEVTLFVERESQKGIVIGAGGEMVKKISTHARQEIEKMSGRKVFLRARVKVRKNWRNDERSLRLFGFQGKGKGL